MDKCFSELTKREKEIERKTRKCYTEESQYYVECYDLLDDVVREIANEIRRGKVKRREIVVMAICHRIIGTSKVFFDLVLKGYRYDAFIILRSLCENVYLLVWLMRDEKNIDEWWAHPRQKLNHKIRKELGLTSEGIQGSFQFLNDYVHSNIQALKRSLTEITTGEHGKQLHIFSEPQFKRNQDTKLLLYPIVGKWTLGVLSNNYGKFLKPETKLRVAKTLEKTEKDTEQLFKKALGIP